MKITTTKIIRELEKKGCWNTSYINQGIQVELINDVANIVYEILKEQKGITIKK